MRRTRREGGYRARELLRAPTQIFPAKQATQIPFDPPGNETLPTVRGLARAFPCLDENSVHESGLLCPAAPSRRQRAIPAPFTGESFEGCPIILTTRCMAGAPLDLPVRRSHKKGHHSSTTEPNSARIGCTSSRHQRHLGLTRGADPEQETPVHPW